MQNLHPCQATPATLEKITKQLQWAMAERKIVRKRPAAADGADSVGSGGACHGVAAEGAEQQRAPAGIKKKKVQGSSRHQLGKQCFACLLCSLKATALVWSELRMHLQTITHCL